MRHRAIESESANERHLRHYDNESVWALEVYDNKSADVLRSVGAQQLGANTWQLSPQQLIGYVAALHGITVETGKKRRHLSEETKERKRQLLAAARSKIKA